MGLPTPKLETRMAKRQAKHSKPYDATFKHLIEAHPLDALALVGIADVERVEIVDADVSAIAAAVDKALKVTARGGEFLVHLEFQSGRDADLVERLFWYNAVLYHRHRLPVQTVLVLLTPAADSPRITGSWDVVLPSGEACLAFRYRTMRLWQVPVDTMLAGGLGVLPLAPLAAGAIDKIGEIVDRMQRRLKAEAPPAEQSNLLAATYLLMGLLLDPDAARRLIFGGRQMRESSTYQAVLEEGRVEGRAEGQTAGALDEARKVLIRLGGKSLGKPGPSVRKQIDGISQLQALEEMLDRLAEVSSWQELLASAASSKNGRKKKS